MGAKPTLSQLASGWIRTYASKPVAKLVPLKRSEGGIRLGLLKGLIPEKLLDDVARPLTRKQVSQLLAGDLEP